MAKLSCSNFEALAIFRRPLTIFCRFALAKPIAFWHRADELGQGCCPILATKAEDALEGPDDIGISGYSYREHAIGLPGGAAVE
ncbi:hypothetical protein [Rhizobium mayense]|uniref:Uncharacterized protein n=1 Tax=Rhizobium mayense TaxID=1312184 RepID=A0ABT7JTR1_9HYPH|nr:hypothetical protein [Rhizobium mayense]MDL2399287.1 hypothetical protein [Rhizobium mayense]